MSVAGKWHISMNTPIGTQQFTCDFQADDSQWHGTIERQGSCMVLDKLEVTGDSVSFATRVNSPLGMIDVACAGTVAGDELSGTCRTQYGSFPFAGRRA